MKKMNYFFAALIMGAALVSCEKDQGDPTLLKKGDAPVVPIDQTSNAGVLPQIIAGANNGGNLTCAEVETALDLKADLFYCGDKIDYSNGGFAGEFPEGLKVTVTDGTFVSFKMDELIKFGDKFYQVGAVIVKGSNAANVYYYEGGIMNDSGLSSPVNASGKPAGLSNLTFCFVESMVVALKSYIVFPEGGNDYVITRGVGSENNSLHIGYIAYSYGDIKADIFLGKWGAKIGTISVSDYYENNLRYLEVKVEITDDAYTTWEFGTSYLYLGSLIGYNNHLILEGTEYFSQFMHFPFIKNDLSTIRIFKIPYSEITN